MPDRRLLLPLALALAACASDGQQPTRHAAHPPAWTLSDGDAPGMRALGYADAQGGVRWLPAASLRSARRAYARLLEASPGDAPRLVLLGVAHANAMAYVEAGEPVIAFTAGMAELLGEDDDAWAALLGHELAHIRLGHAARRVEREAELQRGAGFAAMVLTLVGLPFATLLADGAGEVAGKQFSRDDEREADRAGIAYAERAGFAAEGAARLFERLAGAGAGGGMTLLSTHPEIDDRVRAARASPADDATGAR
jgi:predicted Zn-dependent protease